MYKLCLALLVRTLSLGLIALTMSGALSAQSGPTCNNNNACAWNPWQMRGPAVTTVSMPGYPSCDFNIQWRERQCLDHGVFKFEVEVLHMSFGAGTGCVALQQHMYDLDQQNNLDSLFNLQARLYIEATRVQMNILAASIIFNPENSPIEDFNCNNPPGCGSVSNQVEMVANLSRCAEFFILTKPICIGGEIAMTDWRWCADQGCCRITRTYCRNPSTGQMHSCETVNTLSGQDPCQGNAVYSPPPGYSIKSRTGCRIRRCDF